MARGGFLVLAGLAAVLAASMPAQAAPIDTPSPGASADLDRACILTNLGYISVTTASNDATPNDVSLANSGVPGDAQVLFVGMRYPFSKIYFDVGTAGTDGTLLWYYWKGSLNDWDLLSVTDNTNHFKTSGRNTVSFTPPVAWAIATPLPDPCDVSRYWIKVIADVGYLTAPKGTQISSVEYNLKVKVQDELGTTFSSLVQGDFTVTGGTTNTIFAFRNCGSANSCTAAAQSGVYELALKSAPTADDRDYDVQVTQDGYVATTQATGSLTTLLTDKTGTPISLPFSQKITITREAFADALTAATITAGSATWTESPSGSGVYYGNVLLANDNAAYTIAKTGYVTDSTSWSMTNRVANGDAQGVVTATNFRFGQKITVTEEADSAALSGAGVTSNGITFAENGATGIYYGVMSSSQDNSQTITITKSGYVTNTAFSVVDRAAETTAQGATSATNIRFGQKVTVTREADSALLTGATVTSNGVTFSELPAGSGVYYGIMTPAQDNAAITIAIDGYVTNTAFSTTNRAADTDAQGATSATNIQFAYKVTGVTTEGPATSLTTVTVKAGNAQGTTCTESGGAWYCPVPLADTTLTIQAAKDGYVTDTGTSFTTDRTVATEAQQTKAISGIQFAYKVTGVTDELGATMSSVTVNAGNSQGTTCMESSGAWYCAVPLADTTLTIQAAKDGYVTNTGSSFGSDRTAATNAQVTGSVSGVKFAYKVTGITEELGNALATVTVKAGNGQGTTCTESGGAWYCPVPLADTTLTIQAAKDGYVTDTGTSFTADRTAASDAQQTKAVSGVKFAYKVTGVTTEGPATSLTTVTVTTGNSFGATCTESGGAWYCAVPLADTGVDAKAAKDGYVTKTVTGAFTDRTLATDVQGTNSVSSVQFAYKLTAVTVEGPGTSLSGGTVTTGNTFGTTCTESGGAWYCPVPLADTGVDVKAAKDGYVTKTVTGAFTDRTLATDVQGTNSVSSVQFAYKVTGVTPEVGSALSGVTVTTGNTFGTTCTESGGAWYCPVPLADTGVDVKAAKDGYVTKTVTGAFTDRTAAADAQGTASVSGVLYTVKITLSTESDLAGVTWEKKVGAGAYAGVSPAATSGNTAYFAQTPSEASVVFRATKYSVSTDTGAAFTASASSQSAFSLSLVAALSALSTAASSLGAGASTTYTFGFTNAHAWSKSGKWAVTFPSGYAIGSPGVTLTGADNTATATVSGQTVTVTRSGSGTDTAGSTSITIALSAITNPTVSGSSGTFAAALKDAAGADLDTGSSPAVTIAAGALSGLTTSAGSLVAGAQSTYTFGFTTVNAWPANGKVAVTFPGGYAFGTPAATLTGATGTATVSVSGQVVTVTRANDGAQTAGGVAVTLALTQVTNAGAAGSSGTFSLSVQNSAGAEIDAGAAPAVTLTAGALTSLSTSAGNLGAGAQTTYTFGFTNANAWAANGKAVVTFPSGYTIGSPAVTLTGATGTATVTVSGLTVTVTRANDGAQTAAGVAITLALTQVTNPTSIGATGTFALALRTSAGVDVDTGTAPAVTLTAGALTSISVSPASASLVVGGTQAFTASGADAYGNSVTVTPTWSATCGSITSGGAYTAPTTAGTCTITAAQGAVSGTASATIAAGALTSLSTSAASATASVQTTYTFGFTLAHAWPANGKLTVTFPNAYLIGSPAVTLTGATGTATGSVSGQVVTVTRANDGAQTAASTAVTVALTQVTNPDGDGSSGTFALSVQDSAGTAINTGSAPAVSIVTNQLSVTGLASSTHPAGVWKPSRDLSASWSAPQDATVVGYSWSLDAAPDDAVDGTGASATISAMADGAHTFKVKAKNAAGTWGPVASYATIYVDTAPPAAPQIASGTHAAGACKASKSASVSWSASDASSGLDAAQPYGYALDGGTLVRTSLSGTTFNTLAEGGHTVTVTAYDRAGNAASSTYAFSVDTTPPVVSITVAPYARAFPLSVAWSSTDACSAVSSVTLQYRFAAGDWQTLPGSSSSASGRVDLAPSSGDGTYDFRASAADAAGNQADFPATPGASAVLDRVAPGAPGSPAAVPAAGGSARVTWSAASDDRSGVDGYNVYRVGPDGAPRQANAGLVRATEFVDAGQPDGAVLHYTIKAVDRAGNEGTGASTRDVVLDAQPPAGVPQGLTAVGLSAGVLTSASVQLVWQPAEGAEGYAVYAGSAAGFPLVPGARIGLTSSTTFPDAGARDGPHAYAVTARDAADNEGTAAWLTFVLDTLPPSSKASAPAESGPAVLVSWTSQDAGAGVASVQLWVLEEGQKPAPFYQSAQPAGAASFYGLQGHTYHFFSVAKDAAAHVEPKVLTSAGADATTRVTSNVATAGPAAVRTLDRLLGPSPTGNATRGPEAPAFYAEDRDGDGFPESFVDPSAALTALRVIRLESGQDAFLLGRPALVGPLPFEPVALWNPASDWVDSIVLVAPSQALQVSKLDHGRTALTASVDKSGWILVVLDDVAPHRPIEGVLRADGSRLPDAYVWRDGGRVFLVDDPSTEYRVVYGAAPAPFWMNPLAGWALLTLATGGLGVWILGPGVGRLERAPRGRGGVARALRHCASCECALPRYQRLLRQFHACPSFALRLEAKVHWWKTAPFHERLRETRALVQAVPWLSDLNALGRLPAGGWEETLVAALDEGDAARRVPSAQLSERFRSRRPTDWAETLRADDGGAAAAARPRVLSEQVRGPPHAKWEETLWAEDVDARVKQWLPANLW